MAEAWYSLLGAAFGATSLVAHWIASLWMSDFRGPDRAISLPVGRLAEENFTGAISLAAAG
jgi:hypothetical protein